MARNWRVLSGSFRYRALVLSGREMATSLAYDKLIIRANINCPILTSCL